MILIAGGTGHLGRQVVPRLTAHGHDIRVLTRDAKVAAEIFGDRVEVVTGNVRELALLDRATTDVDVVISAMHGFVGKGGDSPRTVDRDGNRNLIRAAERAKVDHFILISVHGAAPDHPMELHRMKCAAEQELQASALSWTIIRPTAFMELWLDLIGKPLVTAGKTRIFGRGTNPINFVSVHDVAAFVELAVTNPSLRGHIVEVGGPENLTMKQVVETVQAETGIRGATGHIPLPVMRAMSVLMRPINAGVARQIQGGVVMDTADMSFDPSKTARRFPAIASTRLAQVVRRELGDPNKCSHASVTAVSKGSPTAPNLQQ